MIKTILVIALSLAIAIGGGAWMTSYAIQKSGQFGGITIGGWTAYPLEGTLEADPYAKARLARDAALAIGAAEGVTFYAVTDDKGYALDSRCDYTIKGRNLSARLWTLHPLSPVKRRLAGIPAQWPGYLNSETIAYGEDGAFKISVSAFARPNNWLAVPQAAGFLLALNLYDSPVATNKGLVETSLPAVTQGRCND
jgi:hypothetical protein